MVERLARRVTQKFHPASFMGSPMHEYCSLVVSTVHQKVDLIASFSKMPGCCQQRLRRSWHSLCELQGTRVRGQNCRLTPTSALQVPLRPAAGQGASARLHSGACSLKSVGMRPVHLHGSPGVRATRHRSRFRRAVKWGSRVWGIAHALFCFSVAIRAVQMVSGGVTNPNPLRSMDRIVCTHSRVQSRRCRQLLWALSVRSRIH